MDSKQFAWMYLIEHGTASGKHSYYGGYEIADKRARDIPNALSWSDGFDAIKTYYLHELKHIGVNWNKTNAPESDRVSEFQGTFCEASTKEIIVGTIVLNNGLKQTWVADAIEVVNVFDMMAKVSETEAKFKLMIE